jgi:hypothetical protein
VNLSDRAGPGVGRRSTSYSGIDDAVDQQALDLGDASLSLDSRFDLAYSAAHALCLAALRHQGYRPSRRYIVFQPLPDTLGLGPDVWRVLAKCHDMRNRTEYEGAVDVDERLVADLLTATREVASKAHTLPKLD